MSSLALPPPFTLPFHQFHSSSFYFHSYVSVDRLEKINRVFRLPFIRHSSSKVRPSQPPSSLRNRLSSRKLRPSKPPSLQNRNSFSELRPSQPPSSRRNRHSSSEFRPSKPPSSLRNRLLFYLRWKMAPRRFTRPSTGVEMAPINRSINPHYRLLRLTASPRPPLPLNSSPN